MMLVYALVGFIVAAMLFLRHKHRFIFYDAHEARALFRSPPFRQLIGSYRRAECVTRSSGRADHPDVMLNTYSSAIRSFDKDEKARIRGIIKKLGCVQFRTWKFVKMADYMDFGFPYIVADVVILPANSFDNDDRSLTTTLVHEAYHIAQRADQKAFDRFYMNEWMYERPKRLLMPPHVREIMITNPDGLDTNWVRRMDGEYWWTALILQDSKDPVAVAYRCVQFGPKKF